VREAAHDALAFVVLWTIVGAVTLTVVAVVAESYVKPFLVRWLHRIQRRRLASRESIK
jgi:hypothetical protein